GWVLRGNAVTAHTHLPQCAWCAAVVPAGGGRAGGPAHGAQWWAGRRVPPGVAWPVPQVPSATWWLYQVPRVLCHGCITMACWGHHQVSRRLGTSLVRTIALTNVARR